VIFETPDDLKKYREKEKRKIARRKKRASR